MMYYEPSKLVKDIRKYPVVCRLILSCTIEFTEINILRSIRQVIGYSAVEEPYLQFETIRIIEKVIYQKENSY